MTQHFLATRFITDLFTALYVLKNSNIANSLVTRGKRQLKYNIKTNIYRNP